MIALATTRSHEFVDTSELAPAHYTYRIGVMANYLNDLSGGDVLFVSAPAVVAGG